ncbi:MAG: putative SPBc2 prophage-derived single-strand DNA-specific exonuclease YorK [Candidatus Izimaplasma bacterium HR2]|nr:MAG: putative SPBc2 prophage-derived single-strand DNA-specific exonuclease YorK [Candidatus Izimaplasma bacterium HR2]
MLYEIINKDADFTKPLETIFNNRGIPFETMEMLLHPTQEVEHDFRLLPNIIECAERIIEAIKNEEKIFLQVDSDADGYTSAALA